MKKLNITYKQAALTKLVALVAILLLIAFNLHRGKVEQQYNDEQNAIKHHHAVEVNA